MGRGKEKGLSEFVTFWWFFSSEVALTFPTTIPSMKVSRMSWFVLLIMFSLTRFWDLIFIQYKVRPILSTEYFQIECWLCSEKIKFVFISLSLCFYSNPALTVVFPVTMFGLTIDMMCSFGHFVLKHIQFKLYYWLCVYFWFILRVPPERPIGW